MNNLKIVLCILMMSIACSAQAMFDDGLKSRMRFNKSSLNVQGNFNTARISAANRLRYRPGSWQPEDVLSGHVAVMQQLKATLSAKSENPQSRLANAGSLSQTEAHLKVYKNTIEKEFASRPWLRAAVPKIIEEEKIYDKTHYVFYHSQLVRLSVMQDFLAELHQLLSMTKLKDFVFLRDPYEVKAEDSPKKVLDEFGKLIYDHDIGLRKRLLSVNLSFFGNILNSGESTYHYFNDIRNINPPEIKELIENLFSNLKIDKSYAQKLENIVKDLGLTFGHSVMLQIFIPKDKVDECAYLSLAFGKPYSNAIVKDCYDTQKGYHTRISPILDYYKQHPEKINDLDKLQARIVISGDTILNPESGVKIIRHGLLSKGVNDAYKTRVKNVAIEVVKELLKERKSMQPTNPHLGTDKVPLQRLVEYRAKL